ncbi:unnamed protein product [Umbelopsis vinacea]
MEKAPGFKAIIVGGSVAGQTLALAFEKANIDYVLLERGSSFAPEAGASIGLFSNGLRILDQLGITERIFEKSEPIHFSNMRDRKGNLFYHTNLITKMKERHGYPMVFFERKTLLEIMYNSHPNKSKLLSNKHVQSIEEEENGVKVTTKDGSVYEGDIVIGADGVWSTVRQSMWQIMENSKLSNDLAKDLVKDKNALFSEYSCLFGISVNFDKLPVGSTNIIYRPGSSFLIATGKDGTVYWFYFEKQDKKYSVPDIPRYTQQDAIDTAERILDAQITKDITFKELWAARKNAVKLSLEEGVFRRWHYGRLAIIGDAAHKYTPNMGQGGNNAIESAAFLANSLNDRLQKNSGKLDTSDIEEVFSYYQKGRKERVNHIYQLAGRSTRMEAMATFKHVVIGRYLYPKLGEAFLLRFMGKLIAKAPSLDFIDKPDRPHSVKYRDEIMKKDGRPILSF